MQKPYVTPESLAEQSRQWIKRIAPFNKHTMQLKPDKSALLVIDMQKFFLDPASPTFTCGGLAILPTLKKLIALFRKAGRPIIYARHVHHPDRIDAGADAVGRQVDRHAQCFQHVGAAYRSGHRAVAVFGDRQPCSGRDECGGGGDIERAPQVAARAAGVDDDR